MRASVPVYVCVYACVCARGLKYSRQAPVRVCVTPPAVPVPVGGSVSHG